MSRRPNFFIVGAPKCGTTSLYEYLRLHPQVFMPQRKEPHYFGSDLDIRQAEPLDAAEYLGLFEEAGEATRLGEASVLYLFSTNAAEEIHAFDPDARIVIMVRNPVDMMYSWHGQVVYMCDEDLVDFEEAIAAQADRREGRRMPPSTSRANELQYQALASYTDQIQRYIDVFGTEQVHVIVFDDMARDAATVYRELLEFLQIDPEFAPDFAVHNEKRWQKAPGLVRFLKTRPGLRRLLARVVPSGARKRAVAGLSSVMKSKDRPPLTDAFRAELAERMRPEVERLGALLGRDLSGWSRGEPVTPRGDA